MNERTTQANGAGMGMGFLFGALVGAGVALLMAPASGTETRKKLGETARRLRRDVPEKARSLVHQAKSNLNAVQQGVNQGINEGRLAFDREKETRSAYPEREGA